MKKKSMKLATKMALGFGALVGIAGLLGLASWKGLNAINSDRALLEQGADVLDKMNRCAVLRRDFAVAGFTKAAGETTDAAEKWTQAHSELIASLKDLESSPGLNAEGVALVRKTLGFSDAYKASFDKMAEARRARDQARDEWRVLGGKITTDLEAALKHVINPAIQKAKTDKKFEDMETWSTISLELDRDFIQPFLLLRVYGVYLIALGGEQQWADLTTQIKAVKDGLTEWSALVKGNAQLENLAKNLTGYTTQYETAANNYHGGLLAEGEAGRSLADAAKNVVGETTSLTNLLSQEMQSLTARTVTLVMVMAIGSLVIGVLLAVFITRSIVKPITRIIAGLNEGADQVNDAAAQVASASQQLAEGASEQASALEETSSALEEMAAMTRTNAGNAKEANDLALKARQAADEGDRTMGQLNQAMTGINESSEKISKIIKVIEEIAFQTNLLALNAAVEAARAGEHGKGFAVVADEVRNLAQRCAQAAKETTGLIEDAVNKSQQGTTVAGDVGKSLATIVNDVGKVSDLVNGISKASDEQAQGVDQVNTAVSQMDKVTQQNASGAEESASAAEELAAQAQSVKGLVNDLVALITGAHGGGGETLSKTAQKSKSIPHPAKLKTVGKIHKTEAVHPVATADSKEFMSLDENGNEPNEF